MKSKLSLKLARLTFKGLADLASAAVAALTGSTIYGSPNPSLSKVSTDLAAFNTLLSAWSDKNTRNHVTHLNLLAARNILRADLTALALYCENTDNDVLSLATTGLPLRKLRTPVGMLQAVQNLRQLKSKRVALGTTRIFWNKPFGAESVNIPTYKIYRSATSSFASAEQIGEATRNFFVDANPGDGYKYYWVIPFNGQNGMLSDVCQAIATPIPA